MSAGRRDDLAGLRDALGRPDRFGFRYIEIDIAPTPAFHKLAKLPKRSKKSAIAVQQALASESLFAFNALRDLLVKTPPGVRTAWEPMRASRNASCSRPPAIMAHDWS